MTLGRAYDVADAVLTLLAEVSGITTATPTGSLRRGLDTIGDVHVLAGADVAEDVVASLAGDPGIDAQVHPTDKRTFTLRVEDGTAVVQVVPASRYGAHLLSRTGSRQHLEALIHEAVRAGGRLDAAGLWLHDAASPVSASEPAIYEALGLPYIPPELREGAGEIDAARSGRMPRLVEPDDIRGDLHMHSHWSDGRDSVEAMVDAAVALGYEYIAITDHSPGSAAARSLTLDAVARQRAEIDALRARHPRLRILHGCEVDILADGRLDFPDAVLGAFDLVLASLHESYGQDGSQLLARYEAAMRHPLVTVITHPMNRQVPHRPGYDLDYDRFFAVARETGTIVEIDGAPGHMDLDGPLARRAVAAGVLLSIDSDGHRADRLSRQMQIGVQLARRGWVPPDSVINTQPIERLMDHVAAKKREWRA